MSKPVATISPTSLVLLSFASTQLGAAIAKSLFSALNPVAVVLLRVGFAAVVLLALSKPSLDLLHES